MLDSFIIEELRRREEQERNRAEAERPVLRLPIDEHDSPSSDESEEDSGGDKEGKRGVVIIDL
jgi:hypothetical protein